MPHIRNLQIRDRLRAMVTAFREPHLIMNLLKPEDFDDFDSRLNRYQILWAFYENTAYQDIHKWSIQYKERFGLYRYIRNIYNPAYRLASFHQTYLQGGLLDPAAGDGTVEETALPIITDNENIRPAIANIWKWSNWQTKKGLYTLYGPAMGDSAIRIVDSPRHEKVFFEVIHPRLIKDITKDEFGNVKHYVLEEEVPDPRSKTNRTVTRTEIVQRGDNEDVVFQTLLDGQLFPWDGFVDESGNLTAEWIMPYGFIPFVHTLHIDVGNKFGWSAMHALREKFHSVDDSASKLHDHIRREVEGMWAIIGVSKPESTPKIAGGASSRDRPQPGREEMKNLYLPKGVTVTSLISNLDIAATSDAIEKASEQIERELPELGLDENVENAALSGRALRTRQQPAAGKIKMHRPSYDTGTVIAHQMAMSIGAMQGYEGFANIGTFEQGDFKHHIGDRPVFPVDRVDELEEDKLFWEVIAIKIANGVELSSALRAEGWPEETINNLIRATARRESLAARRANRPVEIETNEETSLDIIEEAATENE